MGAAELTRNAVHVLPQGALEAKLALDRPLRVKLGIDVTSPDIHVGRGIPLQRMRAFQDEGHTGVLIVGDYTARIGDPSGRSTERPILSEEDIDRSAETYVDQALQLLVPERTEVRRNSEWLARLSFADVIRLTRMMTVAQMLERDDFAGRYSGGQPISVSELLYPLMQAYDSVAVSADVELGGTDQLYNLLAGREVMQAYGLDPQVVLTTPLLVSWDGEKMSSSVGNNIPLTAAPEEQFGRTMRISDDLLEEWYRLVVESPVPAGDTLEAKLASCRAGRRGALHARRARGSCARGRAVASPSRGRPDTRSGAPRLGVRALDERGTEAHRPGRGQARRHTSRGARRVADTTRGGDSSGRQAALRAAVRLTQTGQEPRG
jgi:tyrosyl-tRNA synthetase